MGPHPDSSAVSCLDTISFQGLDMTDIAVIGLRMLLFLMNMKAKTRCVVSLDVDSCPGSWLRRREGPCQPESLSLSQGSQVCLIYFSTAVGTEWRMIEQRRQGPDLKLGPA